MDDPGKYSWLLETQAIKYWETQFNQAALRVAEFGRCDIGARHADVLGFAVDDLITITVPESNLDIQGHGAALP